MNEKLIEFGDDYFYTFRLNAKFCAGIRKFKANATLTTNFNSSVINLFSHWASKDCDENTYKNILSVLEKQTQQATDYLILTI